MKSPQPTESAHPPPSNGAARRVLIVDDNVDCADSTAMLLRCGGHTVQIARTALDAIAAMVKNAFDVVLLELRLNGMSGYDLARTIRKNQVGHPPYLVAVTGYIEPNSQMLAELCGIDFFLAKPADPIFLIALVEQVAPGNCDAIPA